MRQLGLGSLSPTVRLTLLQIQFIEYLKPSRTSSGTEYSSQKLWAVGFSWYLL